MDPDPVESSVALKAELLTSILLTDRGALPKTVSGHLSVLQKKIRAVWTVPETRQGLLTSYQFHLTDNGLGNFLNV